jgi:hypothetical protein
MALTSQQSAALKADILADPLLAAQPMNSDGAFAIAQAYNLLAAPAFRVWRTDIPTKDIKTAIVWTEYISRSVGERSAFELMISNGILNGADVNVRQGIQDCFSGPSGVNTRTQLTTIAKRDATRAEKLFAAGTGSEAVPATMGFEGALSFQDVEAARSLP